MSVPTPAPRAIRPAGTPHRPSALGYWIGGALMAAAVVGAAIWAAFAFLGGTRYQLGAADPGIRDFLKTLPPALGGRAAAFGTRLGYPLAGGAAHSIGRQLRRRGCQLAARSQAPMVTGA
jgi:hypothetical protein